MNRLQVLLFTSILSFHVLSADSGFKSFPEIYGNTSCDLAVQQLKSSSASKSHIGGWMAGYFFGKNVHFQHGKSPASGFELNEVLLPHLSDYCHSNNGATLSSALDSYIIFKIIQGEATLGN